MENRKEKQNDTGVKEESRFMQGCIYIEDNESCCWYEEDCLRKKGRKKESVCSIGSEYQQRSNG